MNRNTTLKKIILFGGDIVILYTALILVLVFRYYGTQEQPLIDQHFLPFSLLFILWLTVFGAFELYNPKFLINSKRFSYRLVQAMAFNTILAIFLLYLFPWGIEPRKNLFFIILGSTFLIFVWRYIFNLIIIRTRAYRIMFFGINPDVAALIASLLDQPQLGQKPIGCIVPSGTLSPDTLHVPTYSMEENLTALVQKTGTDTIVISREVKENKMLVTLLFKVIPLGVSVVEFPSFHEMITGKIPLSLIQETWFLENLIGSKKPVFEFTKRALDIALASLLIIPCAILFPFVVCAIKLDSKGSALFLQKRVGRHGKTFHIIKFRSMVEHADQMSGFKGTGSDPRHTRVGSFLRRSYIDELPQLINILRGEMSFVGPRPERPQYVEQLKQNTPFYEMRLLVAPGVTGWAQVNMENDASVEDAPEKMQYDLYYIKNQSFLLDVLIMLRTIFTVLQRRGR